MFSVLLHLPNLLIDGSAVLELSLNADPGQFVS